MGYLPGLYDIFQERWGQSQSCYIYSDPHFGDKDLSEGIADRPSDQEQIRRINAKAGRKDTLIILGDVGDLDCVRQLRAGRKILIMGNHDSGASNYKRKTIKIVFDQEEYTEKEAYQFVKNLHPYHQITIDEENLFRTPFMRYNVYSDNKLFDEVYEGPLIIGEKIILSHEPIDVPWAFNIHGHIHDSKHKNDKNHLNVCSDVINYEPINLNQLLKSGISSKVQTIHRDTIDKATNKKNKRGGKINAST